MTESLAIVGYGGHGHDLADIAQAAGWAVHPYDDDPRRPWPPTRTVGDRPYVVGVNDPALRRKLAVGSAPARLIHPTAVISSSAKLSPGVVVGAGTVIGPSVTLGSHTHIGAACTVTRTKVGEFVTIGPGCDIAGDVTIGDGAFLGVGVTVRNLVTIGADATVGAGSVVTQNVPSQMTVAGVPARPLHTSTRS